MSADRIADMWQPTFHREYKRDGLHLEAWRANTATGRSSYYSLFRERVSPPGLTPLVQAGTRGDVRQAINLMNPKPVEAVR